MSSDNLLLVSKRLLKLTLMTLGFTVVLFLFSLSPAIGIHRFPISWFCFECGVIGGFVSQQQRLKLVSEQELAYLARSWTSILVVPLFGGIFALLFYVLMLSGLLQGSLFPVFSMPTFGDPVGTPDLTRFFTETYPKSGQDFAKLAFWTFASGFSERLVPDMLKGVIGRATQADAGEDPDEGPGAGDANARGSAGSTGRHMSITVFRTVAELPRGAVVVTHGLNNRPEAMDPLIQTLVRAGFHCIRVGLYQAMPGRSVAPTTICEQWLRDLSAAYARLSELFGGCRTFCLGYSLGALATIRFLQVHESAAFERMVLLAPPTHLTRQASLLRLLAPLARLGLALPSLAPAAVRARPGTPLAEYAGMLALIDDVRSVGEARNLRSIDTRVFLDRDDELVSYSGVIAWIAQNHLTTWATELIRPRPRGSGFKHLMISEESLGPAAWGALTGRILEHFSEPPTPT